MMSKQHARVHTQNGVVGIEKTVAVQIVTEFCNENALSIDKLKGQRLYVFEDCMIFAQPSEVVPDGLCNDLQTQPYPTLVLKQGKDGIFKIETTEHTKKISERIIVYRTGCSLLEGRK